MHALWDPGGLRWQSGGCDEKVTAWKPQASCSSGEEASKATWQTALWPGALPPVWLLSVMWSLCRMAELLAGSRGHCTVESYLQRSRDRASFLSGSLVLPKSWVWCQQGLTRLTEGDLAMLMGM